MDATILIVVNLVSGDIVVRGIPKIGILETDTIMIIINLAFLNFTILSVGEIDT